MQTLSFDVDGMTCGGCTGSVQRTRSQLSGISHAEVTLKPGVATVVADPALVSAAQIEFVIAGLGYRAKVRASSDQGTPAVLPTVPGSDASDNRRATGGCCGD